jgi:hypothetical protein
MKSAANTIEHGTVKKLDTRVPNYTASAAMLLTDTLEVLGSNLGKVELSLC